MLIHSKLEHPTQSEIEHLPNEARKPKPKNNGEMVRPTVKRRCTMESRRTVRIGQSRFHSLPCAPGSFLCSPPLVLSFTEHLN